MNGRRMAIAAMAMITVSLTACEQQQTRNETTMSNGAATTQTASSGPAGNETPLAKRATDAALQWGPCPPLFPRGCEIAVLHGDPTKPNADVFLRVPGGYEIPPHSHSSAERMILVSGRLEAKYRGTAAATLDAGGYAYGPARLPHRAACRSSEPCTLFIAFEGPVDAQPYEG